MANQTCTDEMEKENAYASYHYRYFDYDSFVFIFIYINWIKRTVKCLKVKNDLWNEVVTPVGFHGNRTPLRDGLMKEKIEQSQITDEWYGFS
jgi:hypothetical protein